MVGIILFSPAIVFASSINASELIELTNQERVKIGLKGLEVDHKLTTAAHKKAIDMISKGYFAHTTPNGKPFYEWIEDSGYYYLYAGENLAIDFTTSEPTVKAWMNSSTHRANILNKNYTEIGLVAIKGDWKDHETTIVVQMFGSLLEDAPIVLGQTLENLSLDLGIRKDSLKTLAADLVMLPSIAGSAYFDILVQPKQSTTLAASNINRENIASSLFTKIDQGATYQTLLKTKLGCCSKETTFALTEEKNNILTSTPITYPSLNHLLANITPNQFPLNEFPQSTYTNLLLAGLLALLLLLAFEQEIKQELARIRK